MIFHHVKQMSSRGWAGDAVGFIGIEHETELLAGLDQRIDHLDGVLQVDVVVARAVGEQERSVQLVCRFCD